jgi:hypothetical protein
VCRRHKTKLVVCDDTKVACGPRDLNPLLAHKKARHMACRALFTGIYDVEALFHSLGVLVDAGIGTTVARFGTLAAVVVVMFFTLFGAQTAGLYARGEKVIRVFRIAQQQAGAQCANVCTVAVGFDTPGHHGRVLFIQTSGSAGFAGRCAVQQDLYQLTVRMFHSLFLVFHNSMRFLVHHWISFGCRKNHTRFGLAIIDCGIQKACVG